MKNPKLLIFITALASLVLLSFFLPIGTWLMSFIEWVKNLGLFGAFIFVLAYIILTVLMVPGLILTLGAGFIYGPLWGVVVVSPASVLGGTAAFLAGRYFLRDWVEDRARTNKYISAIQKSANTHPFKIILLVRLSPLIPFNLLNYSIALTNIKIWHYMLASFLGMLPGTFLYVYFGSLATSFAQLSSGDTGEKTIWHWLLYIIGLIATLAVTIFVTRLAQRELKKEINL